MKVCMPSCPLTARIKLLPLSQTCAPGVVWLKMLGWGGGKHEVDLGFGVELSRVGVFTCWALGPCGTIGTCWPLCAGRACRALRACSARWPLWPRFALGA